LLNGKRVADCANLPYANGRVGIQGNGTAARFKNIKITAQDGKVLFQGLPQIPR
jgi:hypothetical protein